MIRIETLLLLAGLCHFGILIGSAMVPGVLNWRRELAALSPLSRHLIWTHGAFIVLVIIAFGTLTITNAPALAAGSRLARSGCATISFFWLAPVSLQFFLFYARPLL